ncbi:hypothetical protein L209DRAFT_362073 [Thermothelomyces heterothallicus CBS 203.75]
MAADGWFLHGKIHHGASIMRVVHLGEKSFHPLKTGNCVLCSVLGRFVSSREPHVKLELAMQAIRSSLIFWLNFFSLIIFHFPQSSFLFFNVSILFYFRRFISRL